MKERPILFSAPMVRAILEGRKTQTRRVVKFTDAGHIKELRGHRRWHPDDPDAVRACPYGQPGDRLWVREAWQQVHPIQVAEERHSQPGTAGIPGPPPVDYRTVYRADGEVPPIYCLGGQPWPFRSLEPFEVDGFNAFEEATHWVPSIHMPRWASRILLEITRAGVERLQGISEDDAQSEGVSRGFRDSYGDAPMAIDDMEDPREVGYPTGSWARDNFRRLWESINGAGSWDANPLVWVIEFKQLDVAA